MITDAIKRLRFVTIASNLRHLAQLRVNTSFYKKYNVQKKWWQSLSYKSIQHHDEDIPWLDKPDVTGIASAPHFNSFSSTVQEKIHQWPANGYMILEGFFSKEDIDEVEKSIETGLSEKEKKEYLTNRLINLYKRNNKVEKIFKDPKLLGLLSFLFGKEVLPFQTVNFLKSSSQPAHSDTLHLTTEPLGYLIGGWVALEDIQAGSGEFIYYPGSHKLPYIMNNDFDAKNNFLWLDHHLHEKYEKKVHQVIEEKQLKYESFLPKKGDVILWHGNLLHGSLPKVDKALTRKSLIMHYFAKGVLCYHESTEKPAIIDNN